MKRTLLFLTYSTLLAGVLFGCAGRVDLPLFWVWLAVPLVTWVYVLRHMDPGLMQERLRPGPGGVDRALRIIIMPFALAHLAIAALDVGRFHWSDTVPFAVQVVAAVVFAGTYAISAWAVVVNRFFSSVVRVQSERGHHVVSSGPYRWVRHPSYAGLLVNTIASGLVLGSWWSMAPMVVLFVLILRRATIEDRFLQQHLDGYLEYAQRVRYRLVPGVW